MNRKGQTLVFFVVLIPLFIMMLAFIVDTGFLMSENTKLIGTTKTIIKDVYKKKDTIDLDKEIKDLYEKNNIATKNLKINLNDDKLSIQNSYDLNSIFGQIIGIKKYEVKINMTAYEKDGKIIFEKE